MSIALYWNLGSQPSRALKTLLVEGGVAHEDKHLDLLKGENKTPEILALNPAGTVPFITVDGQPMVESSAILRYLAQTQPSLNQFYSGTLEQKQEIDACLDFHGSVYRPAMISAIQPKFMMMF